MQNVTQATQDAADIVLVVDESSSMSREQEWLLVMIPFLEKTLVENGEQLSITITDIDMSSSAHLCML